MRAHTDGPHELDLVAEGDERRPAGERLAGPHHSHMEHGDG